MDNKDLNAIEEVIDQYTAGFQTLDPHLLKGIWDREYSKLTYKAAELERTFTRWEEIDGYLGDIVKPIEMKKYRVYDLLVYIFGDIAHATANLDMSMVIKQGHQLVYILRYPLSFLFHKRDGKWLVIGYIEPLPSPHPPLTE